MPHKYLTLTGGLLFFSCSWFCLWIISTYQLADTSLAVLFFPSALRLGLCLHSPKKIWPFIYLCECFFICTLSSSLTNISLHFLIGASLLSLFILFFTQDYYRGKQGPRLAILGGISLLNASITALFSYHFSFAPWLVFLVTLTANLLLLPACYLIWNYLFHTSWVPITANLIHKPLVLRTRHILLYIIVFVFSIFLQLVLPKDLSLFAPFCLAIPIILLAYGYGWQGALIGTLINSIALMTANHTTSQIMLADSLLSLTTQTLTGILLGIGIQKQRDLNQELRIQLMRNRNLSRQLINTEEGIRREVARELHDEIGQNITAIRMQASILQRTENSESSKNSASMIEKLSFNIYDTTKKLLYRLRPKVLDDLGLKEAILNLCDELEFDRQGIDVYTSYPDSFENISDTTQVTLFRLCQEALNNISKHAHASEISLRIKIDSQIHLYIQDDGIGMIKEAKKKGFGLTGMQERIEALGGSFIVESPPEQTDKKKYREHL